MKMNRVQFQAGLSMAECIDRYGSDDKCEAALIESHWPYGFACPACGCGHSSSFRREGANAQSLARAGRVAALPVAGHPTQALEEAEHDLPGTQSLGGGAERCKTGGGQQPPLVAQQRWTA